MLKNICSNRNNNGFLKLNKWYSWYVEVFNSFEIFENFDFWKFRFLRFCFWSKTLKTHQSRWFWRVGPSKNAWAYRFHVYKWSNHHISLIFWTQKLQLILPPAEKNHVVFVFSCCKTKNSSFVRFSLQRWGLSHFVRLDIWCRFR